MTLVHTALLPPSLLAVPPSYVAVTYTLAWIPIIMALTWRERKWRREYIKQAVTKTTTISGGLG